MRKVFSIFFILIMSTSFLVAKEESVLEAANTLQHIVRKYHKDIPPELVANANAIVVFSGVTKIGLFVGGLIGDGIMSVKGSKGWEAPIYVTIGGGSFGFQFGVERSDILLFIMNEQIANDIKDHKVTLGADASVAAGPLGLNLQESTDVKFSRDIYSYVINKGLFAGVSLGGTLLTHDESVKIDPNSFASKSFIETVKKMSR